ncbi:MAG: L,D-transpeptidase family protein [Phycisphaerae bacterium]
MPFDRRIRTRPWPLLVGVCLVTAGAWGVYAWRFAGHDESAGRRMVANREEIRHDATPLRATPAPTPRPDPYATGPVLKDRRHTAGEETTEPEPIEVRDVVEPNSAPSAMRANTASGSGGAIEITVGQVRPEMLASAATGLRRGRAAIDRGDLLTARQTLSAALDRGLAPADESYARGELQRLADTLLFSRAVVGNDLLTETHVVAAGESLAAIASRYHTTTALLATINQLSDPNRIRVNARIKVVKGPFHAVIDKSDHRLDVYLGNTFVRSFRVGLGTNGGTPTGTWRVRNKLENPEWTDPVTGQLYLADDPTNPIGERWIGLEGISGEAVGREGYGIHGTIDPASIGENMSMGCIRLIAEEVEILFDLLIDGDSQVVIRP